MCEADEPIELTEPESLFPEAPFGTIVVESDGVSIVLDEFARAATDGYCQVQLYAQKFNPDGSSISIAIRLIEPVDGIEYNLEEYAFDEEYCNDVRVYIGYGPSVETEEHYGYSSYNNYGGEGLIQVSDLEFNFTDEVDDYIIGYFEVTAGLVGDPAADVDETFSFIGTFTLPLEWFCGNSAC